MTQRLASVAVGLPLLLIGVWAGLPWLSIIVGAVAAAGALELSAMAPQWSCRSPALLSVAWAVALVSGLHFAARGSPLETTLLPVLAAGALVSLAWLLVRFRSAWSVRDLGITAAISLYTGGLLAYALFLREIASGREWLMFALLVTFAADTSAFIAGKAVGRRPMAPAISPSKTWEGSAGGLVGAIGASIALSNLLGLDIAGWEAAVVGALVGIAAQLGDLLESRVKRAASVKDSGWLVPGHGGALDRLDSIVMTLPVVYYLVIWWLQ